MNSVPRSGAAAARPLTTPSSKWKIGGRDVSDEGRRWGSRKLGQRRRRTHGFIYVLMEEAAKNEENWLFLLLK